MINSQSQEICKTWVWSDEGICTILLPSDSPADQLTSSLDCVVHMVSSLLASGNHENLSRILCQPTCWRRSWFTSLFTWTRFILSLATLPLCRTSASPTQPLVVYNLNQFQFWFIFYSVQIFNQTCSAKLDTQKFCVCVRVCVCFTSACNIGNLLSVCVQGSFQVVHSRFLFLLWLNNN